MTRPSYCTVDTQSGSETTLENEDRPNLFEQAEAALAKPVNLISSTSGYDKCVRLVAYSYRFAKAYSLVTDHDLTKNLDNMASKLSFTRMIFLRTRKWSILNELYKRSRSQRVSVRKDIELILKVFLLFLDCSRLVGFLFRLGLLRPNPLDDKLKKWNSDGYFLECLVWLSLYTYDWSMSSKQTKEKKFQTKLTIVKYICDSVCSYNQTTFKSYAFSSKVTSSLGMLSTLVSLYMAWR